MFGLGVIKAMNNFKVGDKVIYAGKHKGIVRKVDEPVKDDGGIPGALVEFDDPKLIPPIYAVPYKFLAIDLPAGSTPVAVSSSPSGSSTIDLGFLDSEKKGFSVGFDVEINAEKYCPKCTKKWTETWIGHKAYYDCIPCDIKREDVWND